MNALLKKISQLTFAKTCEVMGHDAKKVIPDFSCYPERHRESEKAHAMIILLVEAANFLANGNKIWIPDFKNDVHYEVYFWNGSSGWRLLNGGLYAGSYVGSRLCFISREVAQAMMRDNEEAIRLINKYFL